MEWIKVGARCATLFGRRRRGIEDRVVRPLVEPFAEVSIIVHFTLLFLGELARKRDDVCLHDRLRSEATVKKTSQKSIKAVKCRLEAHGGRCDCTGYKGVGAVSGTPPGSASQVNSAPGARLPFFAPKRDMTGTNMRAKM